MLRLLHVSGRDEQVGIGKGRLVPVHPAREDGLIVEHRAREVDGQHQRGFGVGCCRDGYALRKLDEHMKRLTLALRDEGTLDMAAVEFAVRQRIRRHAGGYVGYG